MNSRRNHKYFITAIGTDSGKTVVSSIFCEALMADYWKPVQAGFPRDSDTVKGLLINTTSIIHQEAFVLKTPASPHAAAKIDGIEVNISSFVLPSSERLIVEGAGGCMVPLNDRELVIDLIKHLDLPVVLVSNLYLGSINHTLLTFEALQRRKISIAGIVFNGEENPESQRIILRHTGLKVLLHLKKENEITRSQISKYAEQLRANLDETSS